MPEEALNFEQQLSLARAIELLDVLMIHEANGGPSIAKTLGAERVLASLSEALDIGWPDRQAPGDLDAYLVDTRARILGRLRADKKAATFVAAVDWNSKGGRMFWSICAPTLSRSSAACAPGISFRYATEWRAGSPCADWWRPASRSRSVLSAAF